MSTLVGSILAFGRRASRRLHMIGTRGLFEAHGADFWFDPDGVYSYGNISVGERVSLGLGCVIMAGKSKVRIGNNVMFGPNVTLVGGGHVTDRLGLPMIQVIEKTGNEDLGVIIEDDVWIGAGAIVLRGVTIGRGTVVAAGSIVTKSSPPYSIIGGNPARVLRFRWTADEALHHETELYTAEQRIPEGELRRLLSSPSMLPPRRSVPIRMTHLTNES